MYALYTSDLVYTALINGEKISVYAFINVIDVCLDVYKPVISYESNLLLGASNIYALAFFIGVVLALGVFISFIVNVVYYFFYSKLRIKKIFKRGCDILIAKDKHFDVYRKTYSNAVLFLQEQPNKEQKKAYRSKGIVYFVSDVSDRAFNLHFAKLLIDYHLWMLFPNTIGYVFL